MPYRTKQDIIITALRQAILSGRLAAGERLRQETLARAFNASSTPVREALRALRAEGLLSYVPHKGMTVAQLSEGEITEIYLMRQCLEGLAARLAVARIEEGALQRMEALQGRMEEALAAGNYGRLARLNHKFHTILHDASGARRLHEMISRLWLVSPFDMLWVVEGRAEKSVKEHWQILKALRSRDPERSEQALRHHVASAAESLLGHIAKQRRAAHAGGER